MISIALSLVLLLLFSCTGGGGGEEGGLLPTAVPNVVLDYSEFKTEQYSNQPALNTVKAAEAYEVIHNARTKKYPPTSTRLNNAKEDPGYGVTIVLSDVNFYQNHEVFNPAKISGTLTEEEFNELEEKNYHGVHVASVISARRDDEIKNTGSFYGIAYGANLHVVQVPDAGVSFYTYANLMREKKAVLFNGSWGFTTDNVESAKSDSQRHAYVLDKVRDENIGFVFAVGNGISSDNEAVSALPENSEIFDEPVFPAHLAGSVNSLSHQGVFLAATSFHKSVNEGLTDVERAYDDGNFHANSCGSAALWCISAPSNLTVADQENGTERYGIASGTSLAAPLVTGALAVIISAYDLSVNDASSFLLKSATRRYAQGENSNNGRAENEIATELDQVSARYGYGELNLYNAVHLVEQTKIRTLSSGKFNFDIPIDGEGKYSLYETGVAISPAVSGGSFNTLFSSMKMTTSDKDGNYQISPNNLLDYNQSSVQALSTDFTVASLVSATGNQYGNNDNATQTIPMHLSFLDNALSFSFNSNLLNVGHFSASSINIETPLSFDFVGHYTSVSSGFFGGASDLPEEISDTFNANSLKYKANLFGGLLAPDVYDSYGDEEGSKYNNFITSLNLNKFQFSFSSRLNDVSKLSLLPGTYGTGFLSTHNSLLSTQEMASKNVFALDPLMQKGNSHISLLSNTLINKGARMETSFGNFTLGTFIALGETYNNLKLFDSNSSNSLATTEIIYSAGESKYFASLGMLHESESLLGTFFSGALELPSGSNTVFGTFGISQKIVNSLFLNARFSYGITSAPQSEQSFWNEMTLVGTRSYKVGLMFKNAFGGVLDLSVSAPLKVISGSLVNSYNLPLRPLGTQRTYSVMYSRTQLDEQRYLSFGLVYITQPGNILESDSQKYMVVKFGKVL